MKSAHLGLQPSNNNVQQGNNFNIGCKNRVEFYEQHHGF